MLSSTLLLLRAGAARPSRAWLTRDVRLVKTHSPLGSAAWRQTLSSVPGAAQAALRISRVGKAGSSTGRPAHAARPDTITSGVGRRVGILLAASRRYPSRASTQGVLPPCGRAGGVKKITCEYATLVVPSSHVPWGDHVRPRSAAPCRAGWRGHCDAPGKKEQEGALGPARAPPRAAGRRSE